MNVLEMWNANDAYFGDRLLSTSHFLKWLDKKGLTLPANALVCDYQFLQIAALLGEIEAYAFRTIPVDKAFDIAKQDFPNPDNLYRPVTRIVVSIKVKEQWHALVMQAVQAKELVMLDYASKLPVPVPKTTSVKARERDQKQGDDGHEWKVKAMTLAGEIHDHNKARGWGYDKVSVAKEIERMFGPDHLNYKTKTGKRIDHHYIVRHVLYNWNERFGTQEKKKAAANRPSK